MKTRSMILATALAAGLASKGAMASFKDSVKDFASNQFGWSELTDRALQPSKDGLFVTGNFSYNPGSISNGSTTEVPPDQLDFETSGSNNGYNGSLGLGWKYRNHALSLGVDKTHSMIKTNDTVDASPIGKTKAPIDVFSPNLTYTLDLGNHKLTAKVSSDSYKRTLDETYDIISIHKEDIAKGLSVSAGYMPPIPVEFAVSFGSVKGKSNSSVTDPYTGTNANPEEDFSRKSTTLLEVKGKPYTRFLELLAVLGNTTDEGYGSGTARTNSKYTQAGIGANISFPVTVKGRDFYFDIGGMLYKVSSGTALNGSSLHQSTANGRFAISTTIDGLVGSHKQD